MLDPLILTPGFGITYHNNRIIFNICAGTMKTGTVKTGTMNVMNTGSMNT